MATHIGVLPLDILNTLSTVQDNDGNDGRPFIRFLSLPHPRTNLPCLFLPHGTSPSAITAFLEVQTISSPEPRSWFVGNNEVVSDGKLLLAAPIEPTFLLIPIAQAAFASSSTSNFRTLDDILETASAALNTSLEMETDDTTNTISPEDVMALGEMECIRQCMKKICEFKDVTPDLTVYRFCRPKLLSYLSRKVARLAEEGTITKSRTLTRELAKDGLMDDGKDELLKAGRSKLACDLVSQYVPLDIYKELLSNYDFTALDLYLHSTKEIALSMAVAESSNPKKAKNNVADPDNKKRKAATQGGKGVEKLKKANIKGMAKLSTFFKAPS